ncbi:beta strand repeat-containing protein [Acinetobacter beijerinckii]|uniref:beta strand repeat-containing protein n=1 Tax=Acinetobacter beijerinckii TaxID=262668 RepID=UPI0030DAB898
MWVSKQKMKKNISNYSMMNHKLSYIYTLVLFILTCLMCSQAVLAAPPTIEILTGSDSSNTRGPIAGPVTHTFLLNANNPNDNVGTTYAPTTTVTYTITESVGQGATYRKSGVTTTNQPELMLGGYYNSSTARVEGDVTTGTLTSYVLNSLNGIGSATSNMFVASLQNAPTGCANSGGSCLQSSGGGIDQTQNQGVTINALTKSLVGKSTTARLKVGSIRMRFNRPVNNPILQVSGLGATAGTGLGHSAEVTYTGTGGGASIPVTFRRIAGNANFAVIPSGSNGVGSQFNNIATTINASSASGGASGSVYVQGKGITELNFDIYIRGDGGGSYNSVGYDAFFFGMSSMDADSAIALVKSQRVGNTGTFVQTQLDNVPVNSLMQYQLTITNNTPAGASLGGTVANLPFNDILPVSLKNVSIVGTPTTTQGVGGTSPSATSCTPSLTGDNNAGWKVSGLFTGATTATCIITIQGTATEVGTLTNTATIESTSSYTPVSSSVNAVIVNPTAITADTAVKEARFTITPDLPTIVRGRVGTQTINIKNEGPDSATNAIATYIQAPQTGVTIASVSVVGGAACTPSGSNWNCNLGNMANGAIKQLSVSYSTTAASSLGTAQQATVKVSSDEFNPGSGVGETLYKVWGTNGQNEYRPNGAFWVGYEGTGGTAKVGAFADEDTPILSAWPLNQASPTGGYLVSGNNGTSDSTYGASSTTASAMIQRIITNMSSDANATVQLNNISVPDIGDNRRAWEFTTGVYIPTSQAVTFCVGNTSVGVDDGAYIMVDGVAVTFVNGYVSGGVISTATTLSAGYHRISYRIVNRNTYSAGSELPPGGYGPIGLSLSGNCSTANYDTVTGTGVPVSINIIDGTKIKIAKNSVNGTGTFNYINLSNLVNSTTAVTTDSVTTVTAGATATSAQQLWAQTLNTDVSFTESALAGYVLSGVSCVDANSGVTGNTGTFWTRVNNIVTIPAVRIKEGADITCTFTNTKLIYVDITGRVFVDNSGTTLDASKAYNGIQDAGEVGIANSTIRLINCSTTTQLASTVTSANGDYAFSIEQSLLPSSFCIVQQNLPEYISVSGTSGYTRSTDTIALTKTSATSYTANNFGDVIVNVVLNEDGQHTAIAGDVTDYPHRLSTQIPVQLTQLLQTQTQQPNANADQPWQALVYRDTNCNGQVDMGEVVFNPTAASTVLLQPGADICLVQRVHVPTNVVAGAQHIGTLQANYQFALTNPSQTIPGQTLKRQDVTLIGSAGLTLTKKVRAVSSCPSTSSDTNPFVITNQAAKQNNLEYEITYKNNTTKKLQNVKVKDSLPIGTNFGSVSCGLTPSGNTCNTNRSGDYLEWSLTGLLNPSASGTLRFCVSQK